MSIVLWANDATSTLASPITNTATALTLASGSGALFPDLASGEFFPLTLRSASNASIYEITYCTARSGDVLTVARGQEGTTALAWNAGDLAQNLVTAGTLALSVQWSARGMQAFSSAGTFTVPVGVYMVHPRAWGGGGGGGGGASGNDAAGGGAGGGFSEGVFAVTPGETFAVTVGTGGAGGTPGNNGSAGGTTSFGSLLSVTGGGGGFGAAAGGVGLGSTSPGTGTGGALNLSGGNGLAGAIQSSIYFGGTGGWAPFATGATIPVFNATTGNTGGLGAGGGGGVSGGGGGNGGNGLVAVYW
jgi:hypothetical protein